MNILQIAITFFVFIECLNIIMLYFIPASKMGNGVGVFNAYHTSMKDEKMKPFVSYLINWVAGAKLIFVMLGIVIVIFGDKTLHQFTVIALIISILSFYYRLYPLIRKMDLDNEIQPKGYYKTLNFMIVGFIVVFAIAFVVSIV